MAGVAGGAIELATAYVQLVPSLRGAPEAVAQAFSGAPAQKAGQKVGDRIAALQERMAAHDQSDYEGLRRLTERLRELEGETARLEERWLELSELVG